MLTHNFLLNYVIKCSYVVRLIISFRTFFTPEERTPSPHTPDELEEGLRPHTPVTPNSNQTKSRSSSAQSYVRTPSPEPDEERTEKRKKRKDASRCQN